jgi:hypothetical protein
MKRLYERLSRWIGGLGIKVKLPAAFAAVSVMTLAAAAVAITAFSATERDVQDMAQGEVPLMNDALRLSVISGEISAAAARFVNAKNADEQSAIAARIRERYDAFTPMLERMRAGRKNAGRKSATFVAVEAVVQKLGVNLKALATAIEERVAVRSTALMPASAISSRRSWTIPISTSSPPPRTSARPPTRSSRGWSMTGCRSCRRSLPWGPRPIWSPACSRHRR